MFSPIFLPFWQIFQLTASQGGWLWMERNQRRNIYFNSQPHKEADVDLDGLQLFVLFQLTASQGGWPMLIPTKFARRKFQLTASQGGWPFLLLTAQTQKSFQLTASQGGWRRTSCLLPCTHGISTHSLTRRLTNCIHCDTEIWEISTHSLTRRLTDFPGRIPFPDGNFNSQPHKEADFSYMIVTGQVEYFNSQPHKEADKSFVFLWYNFIISTHSLTRRLTVLLAVFLALLLYFNSQPHKEADDSHPGYLALTFHFNSQPHKEAD